MAKITRRHFVRSVGAGVGVAAVSGLVPAPFGSYALAGGDDTIKLGLVAALTGPAAVLGKPMVTGAEIAVEQINADGGIGGKRVELLKRDSKASPADATVAARELAGEGCHLLLGCVSSAVALAISPILDDLNSVLISTAAHSMKLTKENFSENYFRITDNPYMRERALAKVMAKEHGSVTQWSGLIPDHPYGRSTWTWFKAGLNEYYPKITGSEPSITDPILTQYGATDYRNYIASAMTQPAKGYFVSVYGGDAITMFKQARPYGFYEKVEAIADSANEFIVARAMREIFPTMWVGSHWYFGAFEENPISDQLYKSVVERTGNQWPMGFVSEAYTAVLAYANALAKAPSRDAKAVIKALEGLTFQSPTGRRTIRAEDHQTEKDVVLYKLKGVAHNPGFEVVEYRVVDGAEVIDPATPGEELEPGEAVGA